MSVKDAETPVGLLMQKLELSYFRDSVNWILLEYAIYVFLNQSHTRNQDKVALY